MNPPMQMFLNWLYHYFKNFSSEVVISLSFKIIHLRNSTPNYLFLLDLPFNRVVFLYWNSFFSMYKTLRVNQYIQPDKVYILQAHR